MCSADELNVLPVGQIEAVSQVYHRANDCGLPIFTDCDLTLSPFESTLWIGFPEICAWPEPVITLIAVQYICFSSDCLLGDFAVATMVAENE